MKELICIVCPKGCHLHVDEENGFAVTGNACPRGEIYGKKELQNPTRTLTSTVIVEGAALTRLPVKTSTDIPKQDLLRVMRLLDGFSVNAPVEVGDVLIANIGGTGADLVATRRMPKVTVENIKPI